MSIDPAREKLIAKLQRALDQLQRIPAHQREAEHADDRAHTTQTLISELKASVHSPDEPKNSA